MRAEVVNHVEMASFLQFVARLSKGFLSDLSDLFAGEQEIVTVIGSLHHFQDISVVWRIVKNIGTVNVACNLKTKEKNI